MSQKESIDNLLGLSRYDLYYDNTDILNNKIDEIKEFGPITKYVDWKKIVGFLTKGRYNLLNNNKNKNNILKLIDLLDEKINISDTDIEKIYSAVDSYYYSDKVKDNIKQNIRIKIYHRYGIVNYNHLIKLLDINNNDSKLNNSKLNNKLNKFDDAFLKFIKKDNKKNQDYTIISINDFLNIIFNEDINSILINKDKTINNNNIDTFINKFSMIDRLILLYDFRGFDIYIKDNVITDIINIKNMFMMYLDISKYIFDKVINKYISEDNTHNLIKLLFTIYDIVYVFEPKNEINNCGIEYILESYNESNLLIESKEIILSHINEFINKTKTYIPILKAEDYGIIDRIFDNNSNNIKNTCKKILDLYENSRELLTENNIEHFIYLNNYDKFIDLNDDSNKKLLRNMLNKKIYDYAYINTDDILKIGFDEISMRNAIFTNNIELIKLLLDNKYPISEKEFLYIYRYVDIMNQGLSITNILSLFAEYNMYMTKEIFIKFCKNQRFYYEFDFSILKKYTIYKDDDDKIFQELINEIKSDLILDTEIDIKYIQNYIEDLESKNKKIMIEDIFKFCRPELKYLVNKYIQQTDKPDKTDKTDSIEKPKKIIKKIIKKVIVKKKVNSNDNL